MFLGKLIIIHWNMGYSIGMESTYVHTTRMANQGASRRPSRERLRRRSRLRRLGCRTASSIR
jgi:hypothetical protein